MTELKEIKAQRFLKLVEKSSSCWLWIGAKDRNGYGRYKYEGQFIGAHRAAFNLFVAKLPKAYSGWKGKTLDHLCRNRACVNPEHLEEVTQKENVLRGIGITALNAKKTHCSRGHEFTFENTYIVPKRKVRDCKSCIKIRSLKCKQKQKEILC